ncbi:Uncharacterised protein [Algoriella xinjiangensis]|uniref:DUF6808 domain-containing protein n=1 Tax=Algoriella xinjiangensis TaxID=684065 RepID=UPI000F636636|nr:hypothetical protein [Algoriella xinjiangensis]VDH16090.1 Uncharacterised protein [Algoriella xinjiangensis]
MKFITKHRKLFGYLLAIIAIGAIFYFVGRKDENTKTVYKDKIVYKDSIKTITKIVQGEEKEVIRYRDRVDKLKEKEKQIVYDTAICAEIVSNLKSQIVLQDTIIQKKDSIIYLTNTIVNYQDKIIKIKPKPKRFGIGIQTGYGFNSDKITPYVGVGVSFNLVRF